MAEPVECVARALCRAHCGEQCEYQCEKTRAWAFLIPDAEVAIAAYQAALSVAPGAGVIAILRARVELLREAHTLANQALRSAMSVAERDGRETNWTAFRASLRASLEASHAAVQALKSAPTYVPLPPGDAQ